VYRIQKELSVSRAFGDRDFKLPYCIDTWEDTECTADLVIAVPELTTCLLTAEDEFLVIACDGMDIGRKARDWLDF
jgi:serine/threonine protein phosphatase PrpC